MVSNCEFLASGLQRARHMKPFFLALLTFALTMAVACTSSDPGSTVAPPSATTTTETFTGTVQPNFGVDFHTFSVAQSGTVSVGALTVSGGTLTLSNFLIQGNGFDVGANSPEQPPCRGIPWILDGDTITAVDEDLRNQIEGLLRPIGHGHVFGLDAHPSGEPDVTGYS